MKSRQYLNRTQKHWQQRSQRALQTFQWGSVHQAVVGLFLDIDRVPPIGFLESEQP